MQTQRNRRVAAAIVALGLVLAGTPALAGKYPRCEATVAERLGEYGISEADVAGIDYVPQIRKSRTTRIVRGVKAWVSLNACKGSMVIEMNTRCRVKQAYTRGQCRVPGLKSF